MQPTTRYITLPAAAGEFGVSIRWLHYRAQTGQLSRFKLGRKTLLDRSELERLIQPSPDPRPAPAQ